jgi:hypothetical protein
MVKKVSVEQFTGSVSVSDGDVTPITRQPIDKVNAEGWGKMTVSELHQQREILQRRYWQAVSAGLLSGAGTIEQGIKNIDTLLEDKGGNDSLGFL